MQCAPSTVTECEHRGIVDVNVQLPVLQITFRDEGLGVWIQPLVARERPKIRKAVNTLMLNAGLGKATHHRFGRTSVPFGIKYPRYSSS